jgi:hypothetical protein
MQVRSLNFAALLGGGVLHTKLWLVDRTHVYVGSANMDWRSLTQVKELGLVAFNCSCMANDLAKIFDVRDDCDTARRFFPLIRLFFCHSRLTQSARFDFFHVQVQPNALIDTLIETLIETSYCPRSTGWSGRTTRSQLPGRVLFPPRLMSITL